MKRVKALKETHRNVLFSRLLVETHDVGKMSKRKVDELFNPLSDGWSLFPDDSRSERAGPTPPGKLQPLCIHAVTTAGPRHLMIHNQDQTVETGPESGVETAAKMEK